MRSISKAVLGGLLLGLTVVSSPAATLSLVAAPSVVVTGYDVSGSQVTVQVANTSSTTYQGSVYVQVVAGSGQESCLVPLVVLGNQKALVTVSFAAPVRSVSQMGLVPAPNTLSTDISEPF